MKLIRWVFAFLFLSIYSNFAPYADAEIYQKRSESGEFTTSYWRPSAGDQHHPGRKFRVEWDIPQTTTLHNIVLKPGEEYVLKGRVFWRTGPCGSRSNPCVEEQYKGVNGAVIDLRWAPANTSIDTTGMRRYPIGLVRTNSDGKFAVNTTLPNGGTRYLRERANIFQLEVRSIDYRDENYSNGTGPGRQKYQSFIYHSYQLVGIRFWLADMEVIDLTPETGSFNQDGVVSFSGRVVAREPLRKGQPLERIEVVAVASDAEVLRLSVDPEGRFVGELPPPKLNGRYPVMIYGEIDGQRSIGAPLQVASGRGYEGEALSWVSAVDSGKAYDQQAASKRAMRLEGAVRIHCEMIKLLDDVLLYSMQSDGLESDLVELLYEQFDIYRTDIYATAASPRDAVIALYKDLSENPDRQLCDFDRFVGFDRVPARMHFMAPFFENGLEEAYYLFMTETFEQAGLSLSEPMPFGKIDLGATWTDFETKETVSLNDLYNKGRRKSSPIVPLLFSENEIFERIVPADEGPDPVRDQPRERRSDARIDAFLSVERFYEKVMKHRYVGEVVLTAAEVHDLLEIDSLSATAEERLIQSFAETYALQLTVQPVASGYRFTFRHLP